MRRKILMIILIILFMLPVMPVAYADDNTYETVRVKLSMGTPTVVSVYLDGNYGVSGNDGVALQRQLYTVKLEKGALNLYYGSTLVCGGSPSLTLVPRSSANGLDSFIWLNNKKYGYIRYKGNMGFLINPAGSCIELVNCVYIEDYLYGVVPHTR